MGLVAFYAGGCTATLMFFMLIGDDRVDTVLGGLATVIFWPLVLGYSIYETWS